MEPIGLNAIEFKKCNHCNIEKPEGDFHKSEGYRLNRHSTCKICRKEHARRRYVEDTFRSLHRTKKSECKKKGFEYDLTEEYLRSIWTGFCPVTKEPITIGNKVGEHHKSAWLDRIIPDKGYVQGNVAFLSGRINRIKYNATIGELEALVAWMKEVQNEIH